MERKLKKILSRACVLALGSALAVPAFAGSAHAAAPSAPTKATSAEAAAPDSFSFGCDNGYPNRANFSYSPGTVTTTVYYNNSCSYPVYVTIHMHDKNGQNNHCLTVPKNTKGSKKFQQGLSGTFERISKGC